jgi:signal transduction histidine kinase
VASQPGHPSDLDLRELLALLPETIALVDADLRVADINRRDPNLVVSEVGRESTVGELFSPQVAEAVAGLVEAAAARRSAEGGVEAGGAQYRVMAHLLRSAPLVALVFTDVTGRRQAEMALVDLVRDRTSFLAGVSNELRGPLEAVIRYANLLSEPDQEADESARVAMAEGMADQAWDLAGIVEDLLTMAHSDIGDLRVARAPIDVAAIAGQVVESMGGRGTTITVTGEPVLMGVGDAARYRQVVRNLVSNAMTHGEGPITVDVSPREGWATLTVMDRGAGVPEEIQRVMFTRAANRSASMTETAGVGLGLWMSWELATLMGGDLAYRREHGLTKFELTIPLST